MSKSPRLNQWERLKELDRRIRARKFPTARELSIEWDLTERALYKDRALLIKMGARIGTDARNGGWVYLDPTFILGTALLTNDELSAFLLAVEVARANGNTGLDGLLNSAIGKIKEALGDTVSAVIGADNSFGLAPVAVVTGDVHLQLTRAAASRQKLRMSYSSLSSGTHKTRVIHPYQLHLARGEWLLIAYDESHAADADPIRCFNIARIGELRVLNEHFARDLGYDGEKYVAEMFCAERGESVAQVAVRFDSYQARYIRERLWHREQTIEENADGGLTLKFPASGLNEIARWVMSYGRHAKVIAPDELRALVSSHVAAMTQIYEEKN